MNILEKLVTGWHADTLRDTFSRAGAAAEAQVEKAVEGLAQRLHASPDREAEIHAWFTEHFHKPPVSHDTQLYNAVHAALPELKARLAAEEASPVVTAAQADHADPVQ